jgi:hypothetical protein
MLTLFIICSIYYACTNDDCSVLLVERQLIDPCENVNPVACSFEFREGKWLQVQDSIDSSVADTIWFKQDSLIAWSFQGEPYLNLTGYFIDNYLYSQPWNSGGQGPVSSIATYTTYNDTTQYLQIHWLKPGDPFYYIEYHKID